MLVLVVNDIINSGSNVTYVIFKMGYRFLKDIKVVTKVLHTVMKRMSACSALLRDSNISFNVGSNTGCPTVGKEAIESVCGAWGMSERNRLTSVFAAWESSLIFNLAGLLEMGVPGEERGELALELVGSPSFSYPRVPCTCWRGNRATDGAACESAAAPAWLRLMTG